MGRTAQTPRQLSDAELQKAITMLIRKLPLSRIAEEMDPPMSRQGLRIALALHGFDQGTYVLPTTADARKRLRTIEDALATAS